MIWTAAGQTPEPTPALADKSPGNDFADASKKTHAIKKTSAITDEEYT